LHLEHSFSVPVGIDEAWKILLDIERVVPCMPGAALDTVEGDQFTGTVKVKLGPINLTYKGHASFAEKDETGHRAVIDAHGRDARGNGTAAAKVTATLADAGGSTDVQVNTELDITGKPAQFGRGVMVDVGNKLIGQFAQALASMLQTGGPAAEPAPPPAKKTRPRPARTATAEPAAVDPPTTETAAAETAAAETAAAETAAAADSDAIAADPAAAAADKAVEEAAAQANNQPYTWPTETVRMPQDEVEPINLLQHAGPALAKRLAPLALALVVVLIAVRRRKRET
jgi:carbon monoxide dehydrogenase subunit G